MSGYEIEELGRIEDALDAIDSPTSEDVFQATRPYDERAIASVAAARAGGSLPAGVTSPGEGGLVFAPTSRDITPIDVVLPAGDRDWGTHVFRIIDEDGQVITRISADTSTVFSVNPSNGSFMVTSGDSVDSGDLLFDLNPFAGVCEMNAPHGGRAMLQVTHPGDSKTAVVEVSTEGHADVVPTLGFYGTFPVVRPVVPLTSPTIQDVIDALVALGLVTQSD